jgi:protoporphyrinogen oxidase
MKNLVDGPIVILGGGPTGLGAAFMLQRLGCEDWRLYEGAPSVGGLSASFVDDRGFTWDIGGHVVFSHYGLFTRMLDATLGPDGWLQHDRESWIHVLGRWVPYPFQNNLHHLPREECTECLDGLLGAAASQSDERPSHFG